MTAINQSQAARVSGDTSTNRRWRRREIIATYASYAVVLVSYGLRAHVALPDTARSALVAVFGLAVVVFAFSLLWLVTPIVRYGTSAGTRRRPGIAGFKDLKAQGISAAAANAMLSRAPDERQRAMLEHAQAVAYRIIGPTLGVAGFYFVVVAQLFPHAWLPTTPIEQLGLFVGLAMLFSTLPSAVIAWTEPDPVPDDPARE